MRRNYCNGDCDFRHYYNEQAGTGISNFYRGIPYQRGYGFWGDIFTRYGVPVLKYLGKQVLATGSNIAHDIVDRNVPPKVALKRRFQESARTAGIDSLRSAAPVLVEEAVKRLQQAGTGRKRAKKTTKVKRQVSKPTRRKRDSKKKPQRKKDIFD